jgi:hypothetical protein
MDQELPGIGSFVAQIAPGLPATLARTERGHNQASSWQMIGTAIDYRLRFAFAADAVSRWVLSFALRLATAVHG